MYSLSVDFNSIRVVITWAEIAVLAGRIRSVSVQVIKRKLVREAEEAVNPTNGVHVAFLKSNQVENWCTTIRPSPSDVD